MRVQFYHCEGLSSSGLLMSPVGAEFEIPSNINPLDRESVVQAEFLKVKMEWTGQLFAFSLSSNTCIAIEDSTAADVQHRPRTLRWIYNPTDAQVEAAMQNCRQS